MKGYLCAVICLSVALTVRGAYKVDVEALVREVKERYADDFEQRTADGNPPDIEEMLELTKDEDLKKQNSLKTKKAEEKIRFQQVYKSVPVFDTVVTATKDKGTGTATKEVTGTIVKDLSDDVGDAKPKLSAQEALKIAKKDAGHIGEETSGEAAELTIYMDKKCMARLVYITNYFSSSGGEKGPTRPYHVIDAKTKEIIYKWEGLTFHKLKKVAQNRKKLKRSNGSSRPVEVTGVGGNVKTGKYQYDGTMYPKLVVSSASSAGKCNLENKNVKVVHMMNRKTTKMSPHEFTCREGNKDEVNGGYSPLNDALHFGGVIIKMYNEWIGKGPFMKKLVMRVHYGQRESNAYWDGQRVNFGDGDSEFYPWVCLDISAHEISHGFTEEHTRLVFEHQSGGINEAFSDMAAEAAKYYVRGSNDWKIAADIHKGTGALRYMDDPTRDGISIDNASAYTDKLDVHQTSGVYNKAFYLLANKAGWNTRIAFETFARANMMHWKGTIDFNEGACGVIQTAKDDGLNKRDVVDAFRQVGVECKKTAGCSKVASV